VQRHARGVAEVMGWHDDRASFDKLRKRGNLGGTKNYPHPELVEGRTALIPSSATSAPPRE